MRAFAFAVALALTACSGKLDGTPPGPDADGDAPPAEVELRISEVLYHPVLEDAFEDRHEYVELANVGRDPVTLTGWGVHAEDVVYELPAGTVIAPGGYLVVAKDPARVAQVWGLDPGAVVGGFDGNLD